MCARNAESANPAGRPEKGGPADGAVTWFPVKMLFLGLVVTVVTLVGLGWLAWHSYGDFKSTHAEHIRLQELAGVILHWDEVLTMSTRLAAATGDLTWEERYRRAEPQLDRAIREAIRLAPGTFGGEVAAAQTKEANDKLVAMEKQAFGLVRKGDRGRAARVLNSEEYQNQKRRYSEGIRQTTADMRERVKAAFAACDRRARYAAVSVTVVPLILLVSWLSVLRMVRKNILDRRRADEALRESERRYRTLAESAEERIFVIDTGLRVRYVNAYAARLAGSAPEGLVGRPIAELFLPDTAQRAEHNLREVLESGEPMSVEGLFHFINVPGQDVWLDTRLTPLKGEDGEVKAVMGISRDITQRKEAEEAVRRSEERFKGIFENSLIGMYRTTPDGRVLAANPAVCRMLGYSSIEELLTRDLEADGYARGYSRAQFEELMEREGQVTGLESAWLRRDGTTVFVRESATAFRDASGDIVYYEGTVEDITDRKRTEEALRESEKRYRALFEQAADSIILTSPETGAILEFNDRAHENLGYTREEFAKLTVADIDSLESPADIADHAKKIMKRGGDIFETRHRTRNGDIRDIQVNTRLVFIRGKRYIQGIWRDMTEIKKTREQIERQAVILANVTDAVSVVSEGRTVTYWGPGAEQMFGYTEQEMLGHTGLDWLLRPDHDPQSMADEILSAARQQKPWAHPRFPCRNKNGDDMWVTLKASALQPKPGEPLSLVFVARDVTEEMRLHERLIRSERLAAIGTLASGLAHEMNNLLAGLRGLADLTEANGDRVPRLIDTCRAVAERGGSITGRLTTLAKADAPGADRRIDIPTVVGTVVSMTDPLCGQRNIKVEEDYQPVPQTWVNEGKILQVLLNLFVNACDSIGRSGTIRAAVRHDPEPDHIIISVSDTGAGIRPEDIPLLFDPFFTTKRVGGQSGEEPSHLGLGLPESLSIVRGYGGTIDVDSEPGRGATFTVRLPVRSAPTAEAPAAPAAGAMPEKGVPMLIVDDDALVRFWLSEHLEEQGYDVVAVATGDDAAQACREKTFDYLFLDLLMPGELDGPATRRKIQEIQPDIKVIIITAFSKEKIPEDCLEAAHAVLEKPFGIDDLARAFAGKSTSD